jgi:branched-chain amino acid transport system ATP-binding protein
LNQGDILGMIGPNGSGKTTLFNIISGILQPASGKSRYKGQLINRKKPHVICRMGIARTFQIVQPFARMSVADNVLVAAMYGNGLNQVDGRKRAGDALQLVGLAAKADLTPDQMTTSDRRRLELARALATGPELLLLDEMMAGLTPAEVDGALELVRQIHDRGITVFMIEHIMRAVMTICSRVIVLNYGEKIAEGTPREVTGNGEVIKAYLGDRCA